MSEASILKWAERWALAWAIWLLPAWVTGVAAQQAPAASAIRLQDGGFEGETRALEGCRGVRGALPQAWSDNSCWNPSTRVTYETVISPSRSGRALQVRLQGGVFQLTQAVTLPVDAQFRSGVWVRAETPMLVKVSLRQSGPPYLDYGARTLRVTDSWTWLDASAFSNGLWTPSDRQALFMISSATPGLMWLDDASLKGEAHALGLPRSAVPAGFFSTHVMHRRNVRTGLMESQAGGVRIWDSSQSQWFQVQPERPRGNKRTYRWETLDERMQVADKQGVDVLMVLGGYAPAWASMAEDAETDGLPDCHRCDESPRRLADWRNWVSDLVERYKGAAPRQWEIWNEPNFPHRHPWCASQDGCQSGLGSGYRGTPEELLTLQNEAVRIIRQLDPKSQVVSAGISYHHRHYLDYFLRIGGGRQVDAIGYHIYQDGPPELLMPHVQALRGIMRDHGVGDKPLWSTESAIERVAMDLDPAVIAARQQGLEPPSAADLGPAYLARFMVIAWASGLGRVYHYAWDDQHGWPSSPTRMDRSNNAVVGVNDSGVAFRQLRRWMVGQLLVRMETGQNNGLWRATFRDDAGRESQIMWHPGRPAAAALSVPVAPGMSRVCNLKGGCKAVQDGVVAVDHRPVWVGP